MSSSLRRSSFSAIFAFAAVLLFAAAVASRAQNVPAGQPDAHISTMSGASGGGMAHMAGHMFLTTLRPIQSGDQQKADAIAAAARQAMEPYQDYRKALADGYRIFLPNLPQPLYHFTKAANGRAAAFAFDPSKPTSLLYKKTPDGGYKLIGVMYTDRVNASQDELDQRIPLSIARWHQHTNFCKAPAGDWAEYFGPNAKFGLMGSINTREACEAAGGVFIPHVFGWMVHVYPFASTDDLKVAFGMDAP